jgi:hypothetical protein
MPDEVENHILKKFEIKKRLGKGVRQFFKINSLLYLFLFIFSDIKNKGVWYCMESSGS